MKLLIEQLKSRYGSNLNYSIARVDLFCHFKGFKFKSADSKRFLGLPRGPWENDRAFTGFSFKHKRAKIKRVEASLYNIGERKIDLPNSFNPSDYYEEKTSLNLVWNLEFKVFRHYLNERNILTLDQLENLLPELWKLLTTNKVKMIVKSKDSNKARWKTNRHWTHLQNAFGKKTNELQRIRLPSKRQTPEAIIKRIETSLVGLAVSLDLWEKPLAERVKEVFGCFDINKFSDEEMFKYRHERY